MIDKFGLSVMKNMAKAVRDAMKPGAYGHVFSLLYNLRSGTRLLFRKKWKRRTGPQKIPSRAVLRER